MACEIELINSPQVWLSGHSKEQVGYAWPSSPGWAQASLSSPFLAVGKEDWISSGYTDSTPSLSEWFLPLWIHKMLRICAIHNLTQMASQAHSLICANKLVRVAIAQLPPHIIQHETSLPLFYLLSVLVALWEDRKDSRSCAALEKAHTIGLGSPTPMLFPAGWGRAFLARLWGDFHELQRFIAPTKDGR